MCLAQACKDSMQSGVQGHLWNWKPGIRTLASECSRHMALWGPPVNPGTQREHGMSLFRQQASGCFPFLGGHFTHRDNHIWTIHLSQGSKALCHSGWECGNLSGCPVAKTLHSRCRGPRLIRELEFQMLQWRSNIPCAAIKTQHNQIKINKFLKRRGNVEHLFFCSR